MQRCVPQDKRFRKRTVPVFGQKISPHLFIGSHVGNVCMAITVMATNRGQFAREIDEKHWNPPNERISLIDS